MSSPGSAAAAAAASSPVLASPLVHGVGMVLLSSVTVLWNSNITEHASKSVMYASETYSVKEQVACALFFVSLLFVTCAAGYSAAAPDVGGSAAAKATASRSLPSSAPSLSVASFPTTLATGYTATSSSTKGKYDDIVAKIEKAEAETSAKRDGKGDDKRSLLSDKDKFLMVYDMLREEILTKVMKKKNEMIPEAVEWVKTMMDYTVPGGKLNRGLAVVNAFRSIKENSPNAKMTSEEFVRSSILGWSVEFLQAFFLVADDIMDDSQTRRGRPCWYKNDHVRLIAINDSFLLESFVFSILREHFVSEPYYGALQDLMIDVVQKTEFGQLLDLTTQPLQQQHQQHAKDDKGGKNKQAAAAADAAATPEVDLSRFTTERYEMIVKYKTAFYTFYLPIAMGMLMSGIRDGKAYDTARNVCCIMGEYFQIQDDYLDCYGKPEVIGKIGTDIQDSKCSWLVVQAMNIIKEDKDQDKSKRRMRLIEDNYGRWDDNKVAAIKSLYEELDLTELFRKYEEDSYKRIQALLDDVEKQNILPKEVFSILLQKLYKRSK